MPDGAGTQAFRADARAPGPRMRAARKGDRAWAWIGVAAFVSVAMLSWWWFALREDAAWPAITPCESSDRPVASVLRASSLPLMPCSFMRSWSQTQPSAEDQNCCVPGLTLKCVAKGLGQRQQLVQR